MKNSPIDRRQRWSLPAAAVLACLVFDAQAQEPPRHWERSATAISPSIAPLSIQAGQQMAEIPAGRYPMGRDDGARSERPRHEVAVASLRIDRTEVTNAAFAEYLNALRLPVRGSAGIGQVSERNADASTVALLGNGTDGTRRYPIMEMDDDEARIVLVDGRFEAAQGHADHPVTETTWAGARAYCVWRGGDLPTEAQWEAAARGTDDRTYPWGSAAPDDTRVFASGRTGDTAPVGSRLAGASPFGLLDMAGSLAEWTRSLKRPYPYRADDGRENVESAGERTTRGGDYVYDRRPANFSVSFRDGFSNAPQHGDRHIGFRCVAS